MVDEKLIFFFNTPEKRFDLTRVIFHPPRQMGLSPEELEKQAKDRDSESESEREIQTYRQSRQTRQTETMTLATLYLKLYINLP